MIREGLRVLSEAAANWQEIMDEAETIASAFAPTTMVPLDPWQEIRGRMPHMLATLSPQAREVMADAMVEMACAVEALHGAFSTPNLSLVSGT